VSARGAEKARDAVQAFLADATTGLAARCAAINTDMSDSLLPATWQIPLRKGTRGGFKLATGRGAAWLFFVEGDYWQGERTPQTQNYAYTFVIALAVGVGKNKGDPETMETIVMRLERAAHECFDAQPPSGAWRGHTLGGRVVSSFLGRLVADPDPIIEIGATRAVLLSGPLTVVVQENQGVT